MRNHRSTALAAGVLAAGVMLTQQACAPTKDEAAPPAATTAPATTAAPDMSGSTAPGKSDSKEPNSSDSKTPEESPSEAKAGDILAGKRQVVIRPVQASESILAVDDKGRLNATDGDSEHNLFVLVPNGDKYSIKTAKANKSGEADCMGIKASGSNPLTVVATACDASRSGQRFTITKEKKDQNGRPTYAISSEGAFLQIPSDAGLIAEELGDSPLRTTYAFVDNGPAKLPSLD
ncbi:hypothetical protein [Actinoplanes sp. TFC3]|uniref:hypothetical protein n=1 Tax=Actinoplanes sp. TFC3 TaxID=1710355 RepID=UPI00082C8C47|nr:hypothetical protein [Actinoplanes sp. TFC3]